MLVGGEAHHAGVAVTAGAAEEAVVGDAERGAGGGQLGDPPTAELVGLGRGELGERRHVDLALLAEGAGHQGDVSAGGGVVRHRRAGADGLVVGVRVDQQEAAVRQRRHAGHSIRRFSSADPDASAQVGHITPGPRSTIWTVDFPELAARTRRFSRGAPRAVTVADDGSRVVFLRSAGPEDPADALWQLDVATGEERLVADPAALLGADADADALSPGERALRERLRLSASGIGSYTLDGAGRVAVFALAGRLFRADLVHGDVVEVATVGPVLDPRPDPTGQRLAYVTDAAEGVRRGQLRVVEHDGTDTLLAGEDSGVTWGLAEHIAAEEFDRYRGYWWAPDGRAVLAARVDESRVERWHLHDPADPASPPTTVAYPRAGTANAEVSLHLLDLDDGWVDVHWDRETYPYLTAVHWADGGPLITVLRRSQQHGLVLAVDPRTGETQVHAELADPRWVEPIPGTPAHLPDGRVLVGGELAHDGYDARCLFADGTLLTPPSLYVRRVVGRLPGGSGPADLLVEASDGEPSERHLFRVRTTIGGGVDARRITTDPGWHTAAVGGDVLVVGTASLDHAGVRWTVRRGEQEVAVLRSLAATPPYAPLPLLERVTDRRLPTAVLYPDNYVTGRRLPVLLDVYGGPGHQEVLAARAAWLERQWWADAGFAVVTIDNRGTPGVAPPSRRRSTAGWPTSSCSTRWTRSPRWPASTPTWTWSGWRCGAGRSAAGWPGWRCCGTRSCSGAASSERRSPTGRCTTRPTRSATWACRTTARTSTRTTRWWNWPASPCRPGRRPGRCCWCTAWSTTTWWPRTRCGCRRRCWRPAGRTPCSR